MQRKMAGENKIQREVAGESETQKKIVGEVQRGVVGEDAAGDAAAGKGGTANTAVDLAGAGDIDMGGT
jgi:hypothetical protein